MPESGSLFREALVLPTVKIPIAAPDNPQKQLHISLLDSSKLLLASWQGAVPAQHTMHQQGGQHKQLQPSDGSFSGDGQTGCCLVFQQQVLVPAGQLQAQVGPNSVQLQTQELWAALPGPGTFFIKVGSNICYSFRTPHQLPEFTAESVLPPTIACFAAPRSTKCRVDNPTFAHPQNPHVNWV
jgi:hypothetical protein